MSQEGLVGQILLVAITGKQPGSHSRPMWRDYMSGLSWSRLGVEPAELSDYLKP